jgi:hypothetical protein
MLMMNMMMMMMNTGYVNSLITFCNKQTMFQTVTSRIN